MARQTSPVARLPRWRRTIIAAVLVLVSMTAAGLWVRGVGLSGRDAQIVRRAFAAGRLDEASGALERWLRSSPDSAEAHYLRGADRLVPKRPPDRRPRTGTGPDAGL